MAGSAVAKTRTAEVQKHAKNEALKELREWCDAGMTRGQEATDAILDAILMAESVEDLPSDNGNDEDIVSSKDFVGIAFTFSESSVVESEKVGSDGCPYYFSLVAHHGTRTFRLNAGGWQSVFTLYMHIKKGWWTPETEYRFDAIDTSGGNTVLVLRRVTDPTDRDV